MERETGESVIDRLVAALHDELRIGEENNREVRLQKVMVLVNCKQHEIRQAVVFRYSGITNKGY